MTATARRDDLVSVGCMCGALLSVPTGLKGKRIKCMRCGSMATIPMTAQSTRKNLFAKKPKTVPPVAPPVSGASGNRVARVVICSLAATWAVSAIGSALSDRASPAQANSESAFSAAPVEQSDAENIADDSEKAWFEGERSRIRSMKSDIKSLDVTVGLQKNELESISSRLETMRLDPYGSEEEYESLKRRYNREVDDYNMAVQHRSASFSSYQSSFDNFNTRVDAYNARR